LGKSPTEKLAVSWVGRGKLRSLLELGVLCSLGMGCPAAHAASLEEVSDWDSAGMPGDITMYAYVPDQLAANPPIVVLIHYCGGTAPAVFGQAQAGGLVQAADTYGFLIVAPSSGRCWDVVSDETRTRDGLGDSHAIRTMASHAATQLGGNPERIYATGDSSGGMMTELLLGLYPDVFKGGSAMAGMPAACRGNGESGDGGGYSGACADGNVDRTPAEWGQIVDSLFPGYLGQRPRVQLFHGDADDIISYQNHTEAIEEWTQVLGLSTAPSEESNLEIGTHPGVRRTWLGECGPPVLDAFTSMGGDHGPSDALFLAEHIVPFLGLDQPGPIDPYVAACESQGTGGSGGSGSGGAASDGGSSSGGAPAAGGTSGSGGVQGTGGTPAAGSGGATAPSGGAPGAVGSGGTVASGGTGSAPARSDGCNWLGDQGPASSRRTWPGGSLGAALLLLAGLGSVRRRRGS
jgi:acetylxylan esterase